VVKNDFNYTFMSQECNILTAATSWCFKEKSISGKFQNNWWKVCGILKLWSFSVSQCNMWYLRRCVGFGGVCINNHVTLTVLTVLQHWWLAVIISTLQRYQIGSGFGAWNTVKVLTAAELITMFCNNNHMGCYNTWGWRGRRREGVHLQ